MKKLLVTSILILFFSTPLLAQDSMRFGIKAGFNLTSLSGDEVYNYSATPGFHLGVALEIPVMEKLLIQPETFISLQGSGGFFLDNINLWYLNIPVMAKYNIWDNLYIEAGPQIGLLLADNVNGNVAGINALEPFDEANGLDLGLGVGAGYRLDDNFYFQLRFNAGFINSVKDVSSRNRVVQVSAIYFL